MKNKNAPESKRRPHRVADILIWTLCGIWAVLLFGPSGPGTVLARELFSDARAYYLRHFGWKSITVGASVTQGPPEAVMLVSFSDYECPFCFRAEPVLDSLGSLHPEAGVAFRFVAYPGSARSREAAIGALCAEDLSSLPLLHGALFVAAQDSSTTLISSLLERISEMGTIDQTSDLLEKWATCVEEPPERILSRLDEDAALTAALKLTGTPTFVGREGLLEGIPSLDELIRITGLGKT